MKSFGVNAFTLEFLKSFTFLECFNLYNPNLENVYFTTFPVIFLRLFDLIFTKKNDFLT